jgi:hypothetical protein
MPCLESLMGFFELALPILKMLDGKKLLLGGQPGIPHLSICDCRKHNIQFECLPAYSTEKMQPLDVGVFGPLKSHWTTVLWEYKNCKVTGINKCDFPALLKVSVQAKPDKNLPAAFKKCGILPISRDQGFQRSYQSLTRLELKRKQWQY